jgi:hypothetical protein
MGGVSTTMMFAGALPPAVTVSETEVVRLTSPTVCVSLAVVFLTSTGTGD